MFMHPCRMLAIASLIIAIATPCSAQIKVDHKSLQADLALPIYPVEATRIANQMIDWFGDANIRKGPNPKIDGLNAAWAILVPGAKNAEVYAEDGKFTLRLRHLAGTDVFAGAIELPDWAGMVWHYRVDGKQMGGGNLEVYRVDPDSVPKADVPKGKVTQMPKWKSKIFEGTERDWWIYTPAQYTPDKPACVMVFQDGGGPRNYIPTMFDNLIKKGEMPVTVGVFINPGTFAGGRSNRSVEYDSVSDTYARFLLEEILPEVEKKVKLRHDPQSRAIQGASSGGICAFGVAYWHPEEFSKVLSWVGSFTNIQHGADFRQGGHNYAAMVRKGPVKPIRVFMQDGENDLDNDNGSWPLANQTLAGSFAFRKWDYKFAYGHGFHSDKHGRAILGDSLRWLWRDYQP